ncbi:MAG: protein translocase subunit SecF, partial [Thermoanaerobaculia bacterium]
LARAKLLLPDAYSEPEWRDAGPPGAQSLVLRVNLLSVAPEFNAPGLSIQETIQKRLNEHLQTHPRSIFRGVEGGDAASFKGIRIEKVELAPEAAPVASGAKVDTYRLTTQPYVAPVGVVDAANRTAPTHPEVVGEIKSWISKGTGGMLTISEPFPEVFSVGPKVAEDLQANAIIAVFISMLGIMFYMALRFELIYGIAGIVAVAHDVLITIGIMAMTDALLPQTFSVKINLPEIAAFLTIIGFSINDTIVIFDRVREILRVPRKKLNFTEIVNAAVNQTMSRTIWTSLTTLLVTVSLLLFGGEPVRGFAYAFSIGVVTGCYSTVFIASPVVIYLHTRQQRRREALLAEAAAA